MVGDVLRSGIHRRALISTLGLLPALSSLTSFSASAQTTASNEALASWNEGPAKQAISAQSLPDTKIGTFTPALYAEAKKKNWTIISMKNDWKKIFSFE
jgi:hypothetical protein